MLAIGHVSYINLNINATYQMMDIVSCKVVFQICFASLWTKKPWGYVNQISKLRLDRLYPVWNDDLNFPEEIGV